MSNRLEHIYEIIFFLAFIVPLLMKLFPGLLTRLRKKNQSRKEIAHSVLEEIKSLDVHRSQLDILLESEREVRSGMQHYLTEFETSLKEEMDKRKELAIQDSMRKIALERERISKSAEIEMFRESFTQFRELFSSTPRNQARIDVLLKEIFTEIEKHKGHI